MPDLDKLSVQVVYAHAHSVWQAVVQLSAGATAAQALEASRFASNFPNYPGDTIMMGVYGQLCAPEHILSDGDRLEIYRPLTFDPMESRQRRALHRQAFMTKPKHRPKRRKARISAGVLDP